MTLNINDHVKARNLDGKEFDGTIKAIFDKQYYLEHFVADRDFDTDLIYVVVLHLDARHYKNYLFTESELAKIDWIQDLSRELNND